MTAILGLSTPGAAYLFGDGLGHGGGQVHSLAIVKVHAAGKWAIGCSGSMLELGVLVQKREPLAGAHDIWELIQVLRAGLYEVHAHEANSRDDDLFAAAFLVIEPGALYRVGSSLGMTPVPTNRLAGIGSGQEFAMGAADVLLRQAVLPPEHALVEGIRTAAAYDVASGGAITGYLIQGSAAPQHVFHPAESSGGVEWSARRPEQAVGLPGGGSHGQAGR